MELNSRNRENSPRRHGDTENTQKVQTAFLRVLPVFVVENSWSKTVRAQKPGCGDTICKQELVCDRRNFGRTEPMKITEVQGILMSNPFAKPLQLPFYNGLRTIIKRDAMLIRIRTDSGLVGYAPGPAHERA